MFAIKIWSKFGSFRDPIGISQKISLPIPPKTTVAGMLAAVLGEADFLKMDVYKNFEYSVIALNPIRKRTFSQNYIKGSSSIAEKWISNLKGEKYGAISDGYRNMQKPTNRELLLDPAYLIVIKDFALEDEIVELLKDHRSVFSFYMGSSEFAANFELVKVKSKKIKSKKLLIDSFVDEGNFSNIELDEDGSYYPINIVTKLNSERSPLENRRVIFCDRGIRANNIEAYQVNDKHCIFI